MSLPLPRYTNTQAADTATINRILLETGERDPDLTAKRKSRTDHTDYARMRGIPAVGRNVAGAIPGTKPDDCIR